MTQKDLLKRIEEDLIALIQSTKHYEAVHSLTKALAEVRTSHNSLDGDWFFGEEIDAFGVRTAEDRIQKRLST